MKTLSKLGAMTVGSRAFLNKGLAWKQFQGPFFTPLGIRVVMLLKQKSWWFEYCVLANLWPLLYTRVRRVLQRWWVVISWILFPQAPDNSLSAIYVFFYSQRYSIRNSRWCCAPPVSNKLTVYWLLTTRHQGSWNWWKICLGCQWHPVYSFFFPRFALIAETR